MLRVFHEGLPDFYCTKFKCKSIILDKSLGQIPEEGKKAGSDSFMWVIRSAACEDVKATFFHYSRTRNRDIAMKLLERFQGYLITDAYAGYEKVENILHTTNEMLIKALTYAANQKEYQPSSRDHRK